MACLVVAVSTRGDVTLNANAARAFSRRAGRVAVANFPLLYSFAGRNSIIHILTGELCFPNFGRTKLTLYFMIFPQDSPTRLVVCSATAREPEVL